MGRKSTPQSDLHLLKRLHRAQSKICLAMQASFMNRIRERVETDPAWELSEAEMAEFNNVTNFISKAAPGLLRLHEVDAKRMGSMPIDQLDAQWRSELVRQAQAFSDEEFETILQARAATKPKNGVHT